MIGYKKSLQESLSALARQTIDDAAQFSGQALPCHVTEIDGALVTVAFDVSGPYTLQPVQMPVAMSAYVRLPIQVGDKGITIAASVLIGIVSGLGVGLSPLTQPPNLSALVFLPVSNLNWATPNTNAIVLTPPNGGPVNLNATSVNASQNLAAGNGATGSFTTGTGQTVDVVGGIIVNIY